MATPRNSMSGAFPEHPVKGPMAMQPAQKIIPRRMASVKLVTAGAVENEWRKLCSRPKADVVLLSAEEKKEQAVEIKEEVVELTETCVQPKNEEDIEIIPVQEEEEETEINFPEPPQDQESSPVENDSVP
ncbi:membrane spanning 4-domains A1 [Phyllostomus discolor]|uniref:Membrane spanning 4-domains A1 n=1 Tax=Phyllostomus discolor TaxID=89673 RepID=A0A833ZYH5_9CHIR|nr:membrane spanning 4-domains A1 [Phyllostomus discolor]